MNKKAARRHRIGEPSEELRSQVLETVCSITGINAVSVGFMELEPSWELLNQFHHTRARLNGALFSLEPPDDTPCIDATIPYSDTVRLRAILSNAAYNAGGTEVILIGSVTKRVGGLVASANAIIRHLDRLHESFADIGQVGLIDRQGTGGMQFALGHWTHDPSLQNDADDYHLWHLFAWGSPVDWLLTSRTDL